MKISFQNSTSARNAFTKVELLVVLIAVAMLGSVVMSGIRGAANQTKIAECVANLRQFAVSHLLYAEDNSEKLPVQLGGVSGNWPWDTAWNIGTVMNQYGTPWQMMYCPGTAPRFQPTNNFQLYNFDPNFFHVLGYVLTLAPDASLNAANLNTSVIPQPIVGGPAILLPPPPAYRVLIADANLTSGGNYAFVPGGYTKPHTCPHLNGLIPAGGNLAMLDGHVEWRPFSQMQVRTVSYAGPNFLW